MTLLKFKIFLQLVNINMCEWLGKDNWNFKIWHINIPMTKYIFEAQFQES